MQLAVEGQEWRRKTFGPGPMQESELYEDLKMGNKQKVGVNIDIGDMGGMCRELRMWNKELSSFCHWMDGAVASMIS